MVLFLQTPLSDIGQTDSSSRASVSLHSKRYSCNTECFSLLERHIGFVVGITVTIYEATTRASHSPVSEQTSSTKVNGVDLRSLVRVPSSYNIPSLKSLLVVEFLEHLGCSSHMRQLALLNCMWFNQISHLVSCVLRLCCHSTPEHYNVVVHIVYLVGHSIDSVGASRRCTCSKINYYEYRRMRSPLRHTWWP